MILWNLQGSNQLGDEYLTGQNAYPIKCIFVNASHQTNQTKYNTFRLMVNKNHFALRSGDYTDDCRSAQPMPGWHVLAGSENPQVAAEARMW